MILDDINQVVFLFRPLVDCLSRFDFDYVLLELFTVLSLIYNKIGCTWMRVSLDRTIAIHKE